MWEAGDFGVAVTIAAPSAARPDPVPAAVAVSRRRTRLCEVLAPAGFSDAGLVGELASIADVRAQLVAYEAGLVAELAARRPAESDLAPEEPGAAVEGWTPVTRMPAAGVSEFFADELATVVSTSRAAATVLAERSLALVRELPDTWNALADGRIDEPRAHAIVKALGGQSTEAGGSVAPAVVGEVEAQALAWATAGETPRRLAERVAAALIAVDEGAADRRRKRAERAQNVTLRRGADGLTLLVGELTGPLAAACLATVDELAVMLKADGDERPIGQLRALVLGDLILRPWDTSRPPVTAHLSVLAPLPTLWSRRAGTTAPAAGDEPAEQFRGEPGAEDAATVDGTPITAGQLCELLAQLDALGGDGLHPPTGGSLSIDLTDPVTGALRGTLTRTELQRAVRRGCPAHPPAGEASGRGDGSRRRDERRRVAADPASAPGAHEPVAGDCGCAVLDRPPPVHRYIPSPAQRRFITARDRGCRFPGCRRPAGRTDLDHVCAHRAGGGTDCANLCCLCRRHHRLKTHAPHWRFAMTPDGILTVTTPSGVMRITRPPGLRVDPELLLTPITGSPPPGTPGWPQPDDEDEGAPPF